LTAREYALFGIFLPCIAAKVRHAHASFYEHLFDENESSLPICSTFMFPTSAKNSARNSSPRGAATAIASNENFQLHQMATANLVWPDLVVVLAGFGFTAYKLEYGRQMRRVMVNCNARFKILADTLHYSQRPLKTAHDLAGRHRINAG